MITTPHKRPFEYPVMQEYAALGLDLNKVEALYLFDPAGNLYDASGNQRHGDIISTSGFSGVGRYGTGMFFDAVDDIVPLDNSSGLNFGDGTTDTPFSISMYINVDATSTGTSFLICKNSGAGAREWQVLITEDGGLYKTAISLIDDSGPFAPSVAAGIPFYLSPSKFYHIVATYDPAVGSGATSADGMNIYINSVLDNAPTRTNNVNYVAMEAQASDITIGSQGTGAAYFKGIMDNVMIYSDTLNVSQIQNLFNAGM